jgi:hypothetical protein
MPATMSEKRPISSSVQPAPQAGSQGSWALHAVAAAFAAVAPGRETGEGGEHLQRNQHFRPAALPRPEEIDQHGLHPGKAIAHLLDGFVQHFVFVLEVE